MRNLNIEVLGTACGQTLYNTPMRTHFQIAVILVVSIGCTQEPKKLTDSPKAVKPEPNLESKSKLEPPSMTRVRVKVPKIVFLTRDGCVNTPVMRKNLDAAITSLAAEMKYEVINQGTLFPGDSRMGYPTPTVLLDGRDMFGLPEPLPPFPPHS